MMPENGSITKLTIFRYFLGKITKMNNSILRYTRQLISLRAIVFSILTIYKQFAIHKENANSAIMVSKNLSFRCQDLLTANYSNNE